MGLKVLWPLHSGVALHFLGEELRGPCPGSELSAGAPGSSKASSQGNMGLMPHRQMRGHPPRWAGVGGSRVTPIRSVPCRGPQSGRKHECAQLQGWSSYESPRKQRLTDTGEAAELRSPWQRHDRVLGCTQGSTDGQGENWTVLRRAAVLMVTWGGWGASSFAPFISQLCRVQMGSLC